MRVFNRFLVAGVILTSSMMSMSAGACEISKNEFGIWIGTCRLSDFFKEFEGEVRIAHRVPPLKVNLPNLGIDKFKLVSFGGPGIEVYADVSNNGERDSRATSIAVMLDQIDAPSGQVIGATQPMQATVPPLARGTVRRIYLGITYLPDRDQDWDLHLVGVVDPPTMTGQLGNVWEGNESDNAKTHLCRVYGPDPDLGVGACD